MAISAYDEILNRAKTELTVEEQQRLAAELSQLVTCLKLAKRSITEFRGLGKAVWESVDADVHVAEDRDSWDG